MEGLRQAVILQPLPYGDATRLVIVWNQHAEKGSMTWLSDQEVLSYQRDASSFERDRPTEAFFPYPIDPATTSDWGDRSAIVVGRLRPGDRDVSASRSSQ